MSNRRTEESVRRAFGNAAPNNLKEVMGKCEEQKGRVIILENTAKKKSGTAIIIKNKLKLPLIPPTAL